MVFDSDEDAIQARLGELYWHSGKSIEEIVRSLGVTRNRLYASVKPLASGEECEVCGGDLQFVNRRSRLAAMAVCSECGREAPADAESFAGVDSREVTPAYVDQLRDQRIPNAPERGRRRTERAALLGGAAALGVVLAAAATRVMK